MLSVQRALLKFRGKGLGFVSVLLSMAIICGCHPRGAGAATHVRDVAKVDPSDVCSYLSNSEVEDAVGYQVDSKDPDTHILGDRGAPLTDCAIQVSGSDSSPSGISGGFAVFHLSFMTPEDYEEATSSKESTTYDGKTVTPILEPVTGIGDSAVWVAENSTQGKVTSHADTIYVRKGDVLFCIDPPFARKGITLKQAAISLAKLVASRLTSGKTPLAVTQMKSAPKNNNVVPTPAPPIQSSSNPQQSEDQQGNGAPPNSNDSTNPSQQTQSPSGDSQQGASQDQSQPSSQSGGG